MTNLAPLRLRFGPFLVDLATREAWHNGIRLKLGGQPFAILAALLEKPGELVSREELRRRIWSDDTFVDFSHGLNAAVNRLREVLCDSPDEPRYIETLPRRGYRFIGKIEEVVVETPFVSVPSPGRELPLEPALPPQSPVVTPPLWKSPLAQEGWQSSVPVKRQALVNLWVLVAVLAFFALGLTSAGLHWYTANSRRSTERAELSAKQEAEKRSAPTPPIEHPELTPRPERAEREAKRNAENRATPNPGTQHLELAHAINVQAQIRTLSGQESVLGPQPSPDGKKLTYMAGTSDHAMEIWVSNIDGSAPKKLTGLGNCGTPRWSPDSRWIAFDSDSRSGHSGIFVVAASGGPVRSIVEDKWNNAVPSWSRDGHWIYFASNRDASNEVDEVFKISLDTGQIQQVTRHGGFSAYESRDGRTLYYSKHRFASPEIWEIPVEGGEEKRVSSLIRPSTWANWSLTEQGILFLGESTGNSSALNYFDFATSGVRPVGALEKSSFWLASSLDGKSVWYSGLTEAHLVFTAGIN